MDLAELNSRVANLLRLGTILAVDLPRARCKVQSGRLETGWLRWATARAGTTRTWEGLIGTSPDTSCAEMQDEARSTPGSGCTSKVKSMGEPSTTTLRLLPSESAAALSATAYSPAPMMTSLFFTAVAFIEI